MKTQRWITNVVQYSTVVWNILYIIKQVMYRRFSLITVIVVKMWHFFPVFCWYIILFVCYTVCILVLIFFKDVNKTKFCLFVFYQNVFLYFIISCHNQIHYVTFWLYGSPEVASLSYSMGSKKCAVLSVLSVILNFMTFKTFSSDAFVNQPQAAYLPAKKL